MNRASSPNEQAVGALLRCLDLSHDSDRIRAYLALLPGGGHTVQQQQSYTGGAHSQTTSADTTSTATAPTVQPVSRLRATLAKNKLFKHAPPHKQPALAQAFEDVQQRNDPVLNQFVYFLSQITEEPQLAAMIAPKAKHEAVAAAPHKQTTVVGVASTHGYSTTTSTTNNKDTSLEQPPYHQHQQRHAQHPGTIQARTSPSNSPLKGSIPFAELKRRQKLQQQQQQQYHNPTNATGTARDSARPPPHQQQQQQQQQAPDSTAVPVAEAWTFANSEDDASNTDAPHSTANTSITTTRKAPSRAPSASASSSTGAAAWTERSTIPTISAAAAAAAGVSPSAEGATDQHAKRRSSHKMTFKSPPAIVQQKSGTAAGKSRTIYDGVANTTGKNNNSSSTSSGQRDRRSGLDALNTRQQTRASVTQTRQHEHVLSGASAKPEAILSPTSYRAWRNIPASSQKRKDGDAAVGSGGAGRARGTKQQRPAYEEELIDLCFGARVALRATDSAHYLSGVDCDGIPVHGVSSVVSDARVVMPRVVAPAPFPFIISNAQFPADAGVAKFGDEVYLRAIVRRLAAGGAESTTTAKDGSGKSSSSSSRGRNDAPARSTGKGDHPLMTGLVASQNAKSGSGFLCADEDGQLFVLPYDMDETAPPSPYRIQCTWTMLPSSTSPLAEGSVKIFDSIALQSCYGTFLSRDHSGRAFQKQNVASSPACDWILAAAHVPFESSAMRRRAAMLYQSASSSNAAAVAAMSGSATLSPSKFETLPRDVQEYLLMEDVLYGMMGIDGTWIVSHDVQEEAEEEITAAPRPSEDGHYQEHPRRVWRRWRQRRVFSLKPALRIEPLRHLIERFLPVFEAYVRIAAYVRTHSRFERGVVHHALAESMEAILQDYRLLVAQLETQLRGGGSSEGNGVDQSENLTLLRAWYFVQPAAQALMHLMTVCDMVADVGGGAVLNVLHTLLGREGDARSHALHRKLLSVAAGPYLEMLENWLYDGVIHDQYDEFLVRVHGENNVGMPRDFSSTYWDQRFQLVGHNVPFFLHTCSSKLLTAGKYINVIRQCASLGASGGTELQKRLPMQHPDRRRLVYSEHSVEYARLVNKTYAWASRELLQVLLREMCLMERLCSMKRYFLLTQGDFYDSFMDIAGDDLQLAASDLAVSKLKSQLELALRTSNAVHDHFKDDLTCFLQPYTLIQKLDAIRATATHSGGADGGGKSGLVEEGPEDTDFSLTTHAINGLEAFTLDYAVKWPLSLLISKTTMTKYQLLFRHLFKCNHVQRSVSATWRVHQQLKELELRGAFNTSFALLSRMLHFMQQFGFYMMEEVIEANWARLETEVRTRVRTVDDLLRAHGACLDRCMRECLLTNQPLLKILYKLMSTCVLFAENCEQFVTSMRSDSPAARHAGGSRADSPRAAVMGAIHPRLQGNHGLERWERAKLEHEQQSRAARIRVESMHVQRVVAEENYQAMVEQFVEHFDAMLGRFLAHLHAKQSEQYDHHLSHLLLRLDFNGFYKLYFADDEEGGVPAWD